jgi:hypothetical protein
MTDKIPALPPRPHFPQIPHKNKWYLREDVVLEHMVAQDARIAELEFKFHATELSFDAEQKLRKRAEVRIAELEREIREARLMMLQAAQYKHNTRAWITAFEDWMKRTAKRNAERENGQ